MRKKRRRREKERTKEGKKERNKQTNKEKRNQALNSINSIPFFKKKKKTSHVSGNDLQISCTSTPLS